MRDTSRTPAPALSRREAAARLGVLALGAAVPALPLVSHSPSRAGRVDDDFERLLRLASVPSFSLARVDGDRITTRSLGLARAGETTPVTPDSIYAAASLTKTVFSYVFLGLVNERLISLDKPVREYLPLPNPDDARAGSITARHLLSHSGGWRNWRNNASQPLTADFEPGSRWSYSGEGFFFLQRVAEHVTGKGIGTLFRERVFEPLGMKRSSMVSLPELEAFQVSGHNTRGEPVQPFGRPTLLELRRAMAAKGLPPDAAKVEDAEQALKAAEPLPVLPNFLVPNAAGGLLTTANDFALFLEHLVNAPKRGGAPAAIVELMMTPQIRCNEAIQWGLGVGLQDVANRRYAWQWGDNPGFKNFVFADPRNATAMVVFTNGDRGARVYERVIRTTTGEDQPALLWV